MGLRAVKLNQGCLQPVRSSGAPQIKTAKNEVLPEGIPISPLCLNPPHTDGQFLETALNLGVYCVYVVKDPTVGHYQIVLILVGVM